ncbi:MAG: carbohydrate ABC transporter permease [Acidimicrobiia bacterium]
MSVRASRILYASLAAAAAAIALFPFYWMLRTAFAPAGEIFFEGVSLFPTRLDTAGFARAWEEADLGAAMLNGAIVTMAIAALQLLTCVPAAYAFAKLRFRRRDALYLLVLTALLIPTQATAIPNYITLSQAGLIDTRLSLILPAMTSAFGIFLLRQYMVTIPDALLEAARMDGLSHLRILTRVVVPIARPAILTFTVFSVYVHWNDYLWPLLVARSPGLRTPPLALAVFQDAERGFDYGALAAGAALVTIPIVLLFVMARRRFVAGISGGEVVG